MLCAFAIRCDCKEGKEKKKNHLRCEEKCNEEISRFYPFQIFLFLLHHHMCENMKREFFFYVLHSQCVCCCSLFIPMFVCSLHEITQSCKFRGFTSIKEIKLIRKFYFSFFNFSVSFKNIFLKLKFYIKNYF